MVEIGLFEKRNYKHEEWKKINNNTRYEVSNFGRFRKKNKKSYRYLKPFKRNNIYVVKIGYKEFNCARLVANAFIQPLQKNDKVYHINKFSFDNYYRNLKILNAKDCGKITGYISKSKPVALIKNKEIIKRWRSARMAAKDLFISYQTVMNYCNKRTKRPMFNLVWEDEFFNELEKREK